MIGYAIVEVAKLIYLPENHVMGSMVAIEKWDQSPSAEAPSADPERVVR